MNESLQALVEKVEACHFECEAGPLELCVDWQTLKERLAASPVTLTEEQARKCDRCHQADADNAGVFVDKVDGLEEEWLCGGCVSEELNELRRAAQPAADRSVIIMKLTFNIVVEEKDGLHVATCLEMGLVAAADKEADLAGIMDKLIHRQLLFAIENENFQDIFHPADPERGKCKCYPGKLDCDTEYAAVMTGCSTDWTITEDCPIHGKKTEPGKELVEPNNYVAWLCFRGGRDGDSVASVHTCDSDYPGAFKVYRWPALAAEFAKVQTEAQDKFAKECMRFHDEGYQCATCGRKDLKKIEAEAEERGLEKAAQVADSCDHRGVAESIRALLPGEPAPGEKGATR